MEINNPKKAIRRDSEPIAAPPTDAASSLDRFDYGSKPKKPIYRASKPKAKPRKDAASSSLRFGYGLYPQMPIRRASEPIARPPTDASSSFIRFDYCPLMPIKGKSEVKAELLTDTAKLDTAESGPDDSI